MNVCLLCCHFSPNSDISIMIMKFRYEIFIFSRNLMTLIMCRATSWSVSSLILIYKTSSSKTWIDHFFNKGPRSMRPNDFSDPLTFTLTRWHFWCDWLNVLTDGRWMTFMVFLNFGDPLTFKMTVSVCDIHHGLHIIFPKYKHPAELDEAHKVKIMAGKYIGGKVQLSLIQQVWLGPCPLYPPATSKRAWDQWAETLTILPVYIYLVYGSLWLYLQKYSILAGSFRRWSSRKQAD